MKEKFKITVEKIVPYMITDSRIESDDNKRYSSTYGIPEGVKWKHVKFETGEIGHNKTTEYTQEVEELDLTAVIKAVNAIK